ncbi:tetratricopeptide repeat protein [Aliifodinibius sp. S!AR15-10]|uniref:tetratricopeptide repeat protein n=1 Tax=Aliifodinibius sp. S!AR15-10 TaxID=2950437 RepID=UPI002856B4B5|nr:tetratricopeptide repeat protein [Aliifodinibius sp. S!AR15-10]MDR8390807.1 tetratricopeptide repeat protein [Aliifodinibius sp. S!AR15-10]
MDDAFLKKLTAVVEENLGDEQFNVTDLAFKAGVSRSKIHRKLQQLMNKSTSQFIREIRLQHAMELLKTRVATISEIAYKVGFNSHTYFSKCFHDYYDFPPSKVFKDKAEVSGFRSTLPKFLTSFVGRKHEIKEIQRLISNVRLLTLTGPGGTGKTRLGIQSMWECTGVFVDGIYFISLANISDPELVASSIAQSLGMRIDGVISIWNKIYEKLHDKQALLLLDNFEHVISSAPLVSELLLHCPKLKILVTSREPLHISGEYEFPVEPLTHPNLNASFTKESLLKYEAIDLFVQRARSIKPDFSLTDENAEAVIDICGRLDGLPLAIELAAPRIKLFSPHALQKRLGNKLDLLNTGPRDLSQRQQSLRATILWSYNLLNDDEKRLLRQLAIFQGGCTFDAINAVCNPEKDLNFTIEEGIASLLDKNLLWKNDQAELEPRIHMFETVRDFAREEVEDHGERRSLERKHREFFLRFAERVKENLTGPHQEKGLDKLKQEHDNLRIALDRYLTGDPDTKSALQFGKALYRFWLVRGYLTEGRSKLSKIIEIAANHKQTELLATVLSHAGTLAQNQGDYASARSYFSKSLAILRKLDNKKGIARTLNSLGWLEWRLGNYEESCELSKQGMDLFHALGDETGIATSLTNLGFVALHQGRLSDAFSFYSRSLKLRQDAENERGIAFSLILLGWVESKNGSFGEARRRLQEGMQRFEELGDKQLYAFALNIFADLLHDQCEYAKSLALMKEKGIPIEKEIGSKYGLAFSLRVKGDDLLARGDLVKAEEAHKKSLTLREATQDKWCIAQSLHRLGIVSLSRDNHKSATAHLLKSLILRNEMKDTLGIIECLEGFVRLASKRNAYKLAAELLGTSSRLRETMGAPRPPHLRKEIGELQTKLNVTLGVKTFEATNAKGHDRTLEQAIHFALSVFKKVTFNK